MLRKALDRNAHYEMLYNMKLDLADLHAFSTLCAIVNLSEKMKKIDDRTSMCVFVGYGGCGYNLCGYRVWDLRNPIVVKFRDITLAHRLFR